MDLLFITAHMQNLIIHLSLSVIYDFHFRLSFFIWLSYISWKLIIILLSYYILCNLLI